MNNIAYHLLELQINGEWLHCFDLACDRAFNLAEAAAMEAMFRRCGVMYPLRLREVASFEEMLDQADYRAQNYEEVRLAVCAHCEDGGDEWFYPCPEPSLN